MEVEEVRFSPDAADRCAGSLFLPPGAEGPVPCVVMGSGLSCVRDQGMSAVAERFAAAGFAGLAIDYRHFGDSDGEPRGLVSGARQRQDLRAGLAFARARPEVDATRTALWGYSLGGGNVQAVALEETALAAAICVAPVISGMRSLLHIGGPGHVGRLMGAGLRDVLRALRGAEPYRIQRSRPTWLARRAQQPRLRPGLRRPDDAGLDLEQRDLRPRRARAALQPRPQGAPHPVSDPLLPDRAGRHQPAGARPAGRRTRAAGRAPPIPRRPLRPVSGRESRSHGGGSSRIPHGPPGRRRLLQLSCDDAQDGHDDADERGNDRDTGLDDRALKRVDLSAHPDDLGTYLADRLFELVEALVGMAAKSSKRESVQVDRIDWRLADFFAQGAEHLLDPDELDPRAAVGLAAADLGLVDRLPVLEADEADAALGEEVLDGAGVGALGVEQGLAPTSASRCCTVSRASFLLVPITPEGPRLIQPAV